MSVIQKAKKELNKTLKKFKKAGGEFIFYIYNEKKDSIKPVAIAKNERKLEMLMRSKLDKNPNKYKNSSIIKIYIQELKSYFDEDINNIYLGPLAISVMVYEITEIFEGKLSLKQDSYRRLAKFQYTLEELAKGFNMNHIKLSIKAVFKNKVSNDLLKSYSITDLEDIMKLN
jgi:hypothetical protein